MEHSNIIDLNQYRKMRKSRLGSFAFRVHHDDSAHTDALMLLIITCSIGIFLFFFVFYVIYKFFN